MTRSRLAALAAATALLLSGCAIADEPSDPSPVSRPTTASPTSAAAPGDLLPSGSATVTGEAQTTQPAPQTTEPATSRPPTTAPEQELGAPGIPACDVLDLPATALPVIEAIEAGGPYAYPRNDGVRFQNREGILPEEDRDYYREFTVETPGLDHRGARRIVTGGLEETDPERWFFTDDHYESFCEFAPDHAEVG